MGKPNPHYAGKLGDPQFRHERAKKAAAARESLDRYVSKIVDRAPELSDAQRARLAALFHDNGDGG